jgi:hypothetical protein
VSDHPEAAEAISAELARPKVLYVMGAGRSGSTILGVALGNCRGVFFAGELDRWLDRGGVPREGEERTRFWEPIRRTVVGRVSVPAAKTTYLERSTAVLDIRKLRTWRRLRPDYRRASEELYRAVAQAAAATHVVDTSHYPRRAREMAALAGIELYLLFLVRDPGSVVASLGRRDVRERRFGIVAANAYLWLTHILAVGVFLRHPRERRMFVRYEDLIARPEAVLREILDGIDSNAPTPDLSHLDTGVPFHGNRLLASEVVALEPGAARPVRASPLTTVLQLPWAVILSRLRPALGGVRASSVRAKER